MADKYTLWRVYTIFVDQLHMNYISEREKEVGLIQAVKADGVLFVFSSEFSPPAYLFYFFTVNRISEKEENTVPQASIGHNKHG